MRAIFRNTTTQMHAVIEVANVTVHVTFFSGTRSRVNFSSEVFYVGSSEHVTCSSGLDATSIEWLYKGTVVASSSTGSVQLTFDPVTESIHQREYICRISTVNNGIVEYNAIIFVAGE